MANSVSPISVLSNAFVSQAASLETGIATMRKTNDVAKQQGAALVQMIEQALPPAGDRLVDVYA